LTVIVESRRRDSNRRNLRFLPEQKLSGFCPDTRFIGYCAVFKVREEACTLRGAQGPKPSSGRRRAGLSKLNSMRCHFAEQNNIWENLRFSRLTFDSFGKPGLPPVQLVSECPGAISDFSKANRGAIRQVRSTYLVPDD